MLGFVLGMTALSGPLQSPTPLALWEPQVGDAFVVDTESNTGYLIHQNGEFTSFEVVTGRREVVRYIGRTYNAATPNRSWKVESNETKGDRFTFGVTGRFLRLYDEDGKTPYGIHPYKFEDKMFSENGRFGSMGCIIVRESTMDLLIKTFDLNGGSLDTTTTYGLASLAEKQALLMKEKKEG